MKWDSLWGYVGTAIRIGFLVYGGLMIEKDMKIGGFDNYKNFYEHYLDLLSMVRTSKYPKLVKQA